MLIKMGVYIDRVSRGCRRAFVIIDTVFERYGEEAVITSTDEGNHSPSSLHYDRQDYGAVDIRKPKKKRGKILAELRTALGKKYDVIEEGDHFHIENENRK